MKENINGLFLSNAKTFRRICAKRHWNAEDYASEIVEHININGHFNDTTIDMEYWDGNDNLEHDYFDRKAEAEIQAVDGLANVRICKWSELTSDEELEEILREPLYSFRA